jgi:cytoskeletal protein CcmA (bactofilin family)
MALQAPFFGKREPAVLGLRPSPSHAQQAPLGKPLNPSSSSPTSAASSSTLPSEVSPMQASTPATSTSSATKTSGSTLTVGPNIKLKGVEITDCDTLVVEGIVEATMDSRLMQITADGAFKGAADIDIAEIHGSFDGVLTVRDKLVIYSTGKVTGTVRYGKLVVEEGGQLSGEIAFGTSKAAPVIKADLQAIAA